MMMPTGHPDVSLPAPEGYRHCVTVTTRITDLDPSGYISAARYMNYMEQSRVRYYRDLGLWHGHTAGVGVIVARITIEYRLPLTIDVPMVAVWSRISRLGNKSFDLHSLVVRLPDGAVAAAGVTISTTYDYHAQTAVRIPDHWREVITAYEPGLAASQT